MFHLWLYMTLIYICRVGFEIEMIDGTSSLNWNVNHSKRTRRENEHQLTTVTKIRRDTIETKRTQRSPWQMIVPKTYHSCRTRSYLRPTPLPSLLQPMTEYIFLIYTLFKQQKDSRLHLHRTSISARSRAHHKIMNESRSNLARTLP